MEPLSAVLQVLAGKKPPSKTYEKAVHEMDRLSGWKLSNTPAEERVAGEPTIWAGGEALVLRDMVAKVHALTDNCPDSSRDSDVQFLKDLVPAGVRTRAAKEKKAPKDDAEQATPQPSILPPSGFLGMEVRGRCVHIRTCVHNVFFRVRTCYIYIYIYSQPRNPRNCIYNHLL